MLILAQFCKWTSCYQTTWAICVVIFTHGPRRWNHGSTGGLFLLLLLLLLLLHTTKFVSGH